MICTLLSPCSCVVPCDTCAFCAPFVVLAIFLRRFVVSPYAVFGYLLNYAPWVNVMLFYFRAAVLSLAILHQLIVIEA